VTLFAAAVATLPFGMLVDRVDRTRLLATTVLVWCIAIGVVGFSTDDTMLAEFRG
jgi:MFS family permease